MATRLRRAVEHPIREELSWDERWLGPDQSLIWCWELGRQRRVKELELAERADRGELVSLGWKRGTLRYLAEWQGLRGEDLDIPLDGKQAIVCTKTGKTSVFKAGAPSDEEREVDVPSSSQGMPPNEAK